MTSFSAQVDAWVAETRDRQEAVFKKSAERVIEAMQTPVAKGGNLPIDTGFMRASLQVGLNNVPVGLTEQKPKDPPERQPDEQIYDWNPDDAVLTIAQARLGDTIFATYGANYTQYQEAKRGFRALAAQRWQEIVTQVVDEYRRRASR